MGELVVESNDVWKAKWYVVELKDGKPALPDGWTSRHLTRDGKIEELYFLETELPKAATWKNPPSANWIKPMVPKDIKTPLQIPKCPQAKALVRALLVDFETIKFNDPDPKKDDIWKLYNAFKKCTCSNYCKPKAMTPGRRLIER